MAWCLLWGFILPKGNLYRNILQCFYPLYCWLKLGYFPTRGLFSSVLNISVNVFPRIWASLVAQMVKNLPAMQEIQVQSLGWDDPLLKRMATHSSILVWRIPWTEEPSGLPSMVCRVRHNWVHTQELLNITCLNYLFPTGIVDFSFVLFTHIS